MPHTKAHNMEGKGKKRVPEKPTERKPEPPSMKGKAKGKKDDGKDRAMMGRGPKSKTKREPFTGGPKPKQDQLESKKEEKKTKKTRSERITERADKKWDKDKKLRTKQKIASEEGKDKNLKELVKEEKKLERS